MMVTIPGGLLPTIAIIDNNLKALQRLYRYIQEQPAYASCPRCMTFRYVWRDCLKYGDIAMIEWVNAQPPLRGEYNKDMRDQLRNAFASGSYATVVWLLTHRPEYKLWISNADLEVMVRAGDDRLQLFQWLEATVSYLPYASNVMDAAAGAGQVELIQYLHTFGTGACTSDAMDYAAQFGRLEVVRFLHTNRTEGCTTHAMDWAAVGGHLEVVRFLHEHRTEGCTERAMDWAGNLEVLRFLHKHRTEGCSPEAMDRAASRGNLQMVTFLHENRSEGCTTKAMNGAASGGHLEIVRFLHENRTEGCTRRAVDGAASNGHLDVVQFLFEQLKVRGTEKAMAQAAANGHFEIVRFFQDNHIKSTYWKAMQAAARGGHVEILQYLLEISSKSCTPRSMLHAATGGHLEVVTLLHDLFHPKYCSRDAVDGAALFGQFAVIKSLNENCTQWSPYALDRAAQYGYLPLVQYLVEKRDDGCLLEARSTAKRYHNRSVKEYLTTSIDPSIKVASVAHWSCKGQPRRLCQKRV